MSDKEGTPSNKGIQSILKSSKQKAKDKDKPSKEESDSDPKSEQSKKKSLPKFPFQRKTSKHLDEKRPRAKSISHSPPTSSTDSSPPSESTFSDQEDTTIKKTSSQLGGIATNLIKQDRKVRNSIHVLESSDKQEPRQRSGTFFDRFLNIGRSKPSNLKTNKIVNEIVELASKEGYKVDKTYITEAVGSLIKRVGQDMILEESDFVRLFVGKLGQPPVLKRLFSIFDADHDGQLGPRELFLGLARLDYRNQKKSDKYEKPLRILFDAYDDDASSYLEHNELLCVKNQIVDMAMHRGFDSTKARDKAEELCRKLDPFNDGKVKYEQFQSIGQSMDLLDYLLPDVLYDCDDRAAILKMSSFTDENLDEDTLLLFKMVRSSDPFDTDKATHLLTDNQVDINAADSHGNTPLHYAVHNNNLTLAKWLLHQPQINVNRVYRSGVTALHTAAESGTQDLLILLLDHHADINAKDALGWTPLHAAIRAQQTQSGGHIHNCIRELVLHGADLSIQDNDLCTPLDIAARYAQAEYLEFLVQHGADVNHKSKSGLTPIHWASNLVDVTTLSNLIALGGKPDATSEYSVTPLHLAAQAGRYNCLERLLLEKSVNPKGLIALDNLGRTPLILATIHGDPRSLRLLIKHGPQALEIKDGNGCDPMTYAQRGQKKEIIQIIEAGPMREQSEFSKKLLASFREGKGDTTVVMNMLRQTDADVDAANENGTTLLHYAAMHGHRDILDFLIKKKAQVNIGNNRNTCPIHKAAERGEEECLQLLIQAGADINIQDVDGVTPLHRALNVLKKKAGKDRSTHIIACIKRLVKSRAKLNLSDKQGRVPLDLAAEYGLTDIVRLLSEAGADVHRESKNRWTPMHWAVANGHLETMLALYDLGARLKYWLPPIHLAIERLHRDLIQPLLQLSVTHGVMQFRDPQGQSVLHAAAACGDVFILQQILEHLEQQGQARHHINDRDGQGNTPLHLARTQDIAEILLKQGATLHLLNQHQESPMVHTLMLRGDLQLLQYLQEAGGNLQDVNREGLSLLYISARGEFQDCIEYLLREGLIYTEEAPTRPSPQDKDKDRIYFDLPRGSTALTPNLSGSMALTAAPSYYPVVVSGTVTGLVNHLCSSKFADKNYFKEFFTTYRQFINSPELIHRLIRKLKEEYPEDVSPLTSSSGAQEDSILEPVMLYKKGDVGAFAALHYWISYYSQDFDAIARHFFDFANSIKSSCILKSKVKKLEQLLTDKMYSNAVTPKGAVMIFPQSHSQEFTKYSIPGQNRDIVSFRAEDVAYQMTLIESALFREIPRKELFGRPWEKKGGAAEATAPHLWKCIRRTNLTSSWVMTEVLNQEKRASRSKVLKHFVQIAEKCLELQNYQGMAEILAGLGNAAIIRLKSWEDLPGKLRHSYDRMLHLLSNDKNYAAYRSLIRSQEGPCIPFLFLCFQDLTFALEGNPDHVVGTELVNFKQNSVISTIISQIDRYQRQAYPDNLSKMTEESLYLHFYLQFNTATFLSDNEAWSKTLKLEPKP